MPINSEYDLTGFGGGMPIDQPLIYYVIPTGDSLGKLPPQTDRVNGVNTQYNLGNYGGDYIDKQIQYYVIPVESLLNIVFSNDYNTSFINSSGSIGFAQKFNSTFQSFAGGVIRKTNRGMIVEPAATNLIAPSDLQNVAYSLTNSFASVNAKIPLIPGGTAWEYVANATAGLKNRTGLGVFSASREALSILVETTATSNKILCYIADATNGNALSVAIEVLNFATTPGVSLGLGNSTSQRYGLVNLGIGPNGGTVYLVVMTGIPVTAGNTRRFFIYPNGNSPTLGSSLIIHHFQHEVGNLATSPILNPSTTALSRLAEVITFAMTNGTYDVRYATNDGILNNDRLGVVVGNGLITIPTDIPEISGPLISQPLVSLRNGYISSINVWNRATAIHVLGDSFATPAGLLTYLPSKHYRPRAWTFDGIGGSTLAQEATRFNSTPQYYGDILIILDGGLDDTLVQAIAAIDSMVAHLGAPKKWLYIQSSPNANFAIGTPTYTTWAATNAGLKAAYPDNYVETLDWMFAHGDGSANDNSDKASGWWPRSLRFDFIHTNNLGGFWLSQRINDAVYIKSW